MKRIVLGILVVALAACTAKKAASSAPAVALNPLTVGAAKYPGYTQAEFDQGKSLYEGNCGKCHGLKEPSSRNEEQWKHEVAAMAPKANRKAGSEVIGAKEQELLVKYLVSAGTAARGGK